MKRIVLLLALFVAVVILAILATFSGSLTMTKTGPLSHDELREAIRLGAEWTVYAQEESGHLVYEFHPLTDRYSAGDSIVRQAGTFYSLGEVLRADHSDPYEVADALTHGLTYLEANSSEGWRNLQKFRCVSMEGACRTGATALALLSAIDLVEARPDLQPEFQELIQDYAHFLLAMHREERGFSKMYNLNSEERLEEESPFFNGEALLALVRYQQYQPSDELAQLIDDTYSYMERLYGGQFGTEFYLWGMALVKELDAMGPDDRYFEFVQPYTDWMLSLLTPKRDTEANRCAHMEGVVSAYSVLEPRLSASEKAEYKEHIDYWSRKLLGLQVTDTSPIYPALSPASKERSYGGFLTGESEILQRIDYTQHCVSMYLQALVDIENASLVR